MKRVALGVVADWHALEDACSPRESRLSVATVPTRPLVINHVVTAAVLSLCIEPVHCKTVT